MQLPTWANYFCYFVTFFSLLYGILPSWESFSEYPGFQRWYKFAMIFIIKFGSLNFRSLIHQQIEATSNRAGTDSK